MPDYCIKTIVQQPKSKENPLGMETTTERLVRSKNEARAVAHVIKDTIIMRRATTDDVIRLTQAGVKMEVAE